MKPVAQTELLFQTQVMKFLCTSGLTFGVGYALYHFIWSQFLVGVIMIPVICLQSYSVYALSRHGYRLRYAYIVGVAQIAATVAFVDYVSLPATYWIFASAVANCFILPARPALLINMSAMTVVGWRISGEPEFLFRFVSSYFLMNMFLYFFSRQLDEKTSEVNELLYRDPLTRVGNRLAMDDALRVSHHSFERYGNVVSLLMLDLDFFKKVNDLYGHTEGDRLLLELAELIRGRLRVSDRLFRFGGEEFIIVAENTDLDNALVLAEGIRELVAAQIFPNVGSITISIGVAQLRSGESTDGWLKRADDALYQAKALGRNTVCHSD